MAEIKLYKSSGKGFKIIALSLPFVMIGIWVILREQNGTFDYYMGWFTTLFFGLGVLIGIFTFFDKRVQIIINENGIFDKTLKQGQIEWKHIIEAYPLDISDQKFISIIVNEAFDSETKQYKWVEKLNEIIGAQKLNLNLSQIKVDEIKLSELINKLIHSEKNERSNHIRIFLSNQKLNTTFEFHNYLLYLFILIILIVASLSNFTAFMTIIVIMGCSALIAKWYSGTNNKSLIYKWSKIITFLGFMNMIVLLFIFEIYDFTSNKIGIKITNEIEVHKSKFGKYPNEIKNIIEKQDFNLLQSYIVNKIEYNCDGQEYVLELEYLNHNKKEFDKELKEWY